MEQSVATPIEQQMSGVDNMNYMYSLNANNGTHEACIVNFDVKTNPNTDQILTQMRQNQAQSQLPLDVRNYGVTVQKSRFATADDTSPSTPRRAPTTQLSSPIMPTSI